MLHFPRLCAAMLSWSQRRQFLIIAGAILSAAAFFGVSVFVSWYRAPSCFDKKQNKDERGVDCGGSCSLLCPNDATAPLIHFVRALPAGEAVWSVVAYVENKNPAAGALRVPYVFKLYDADNLLAFERRGETFIPPQSAFPVVEGGLRVGERMPTRATFEFLAPPRFLTMGEQPRLVIRNRAFREEGGVSRVEAELYNPALTAVADVVVSALLYDSVGNVFAASDTVIKEIAPQSAAALDFAWQRTFSAPPARSEIFYQVPPQQ